MIREVKKSAAVSWEGGVSKAIMGWGRRIGLYIRARRRVGFVLEMFE